MPEEVEYPPWGSTGAVVSVDVVAACPPPYRLLLVRTLRTLHVVLGTVSTAASTAAARTPCAGTTSSRPARLMANDEATERLSRTAVLFPGTKRSVALPCDKTAAKAAVTKVADMLQSCPARVNQAPLDLMLAQTPDGDNTGSDAPCRVGIQDRKSVV